MFLKGPLIIDGISLERSEIMVIADIKCIAFLSFKKFLFYELLNDFVFNFLSVNYSMISKQNG